MFNRVTAVLLFSLTLITSGCGASSMKNPDIKQNPNPKMRYEITMTVHGGPKGFDTVQGTMVYEVQNHDTCVRADPTSGHQSNMAQFIPFEIKKVDDHTYKGSVVTDYFLDSDYYGLGVCRWVMSAAMASFKINGNGVDFGPSILNEDLVAERPADVYFPLAELSNDDRLKYGDGGQRLADVSPKIRNAVFYITLSSRKVTP